MNKSQCPIPDELLIPVLNRVAKETGIGFDSFTELEAALCRKQCGEQWTHIETDIIRRRAITLRKRGVLEGTGKGNKGKRKLKEPR